MTNGTFDNFTALDNIEAAKIGRDAFLDPEIEIVPDISFFPSIILDEKADYLKSQINSSYSRHSLLMIILKFFLIVSCVD